MIKKEVKIECSNCKKEFYRKHSNGGYIEHNNIISNIQIAINRYQESKDIESLFKWSINLSGNFCMIKHNKYEAGIEIFNCVLLWLKNNGQKSLYKLLLEKNVDVKNEYNKITQLLIDEKIEEIKELEQRIV